MAQEKEPTLAEKIKADRDKKNDAYDRDWGRRAAEKAEKGIGADKQGKK